MRKPTLTRERILAIAKAKGHFRVSARYRDDRLRSLCRRMVREGALRKMSYRKVSKVVHDDPRAALFFEPVKGVGPIHIGEVLSETRTVGYPPRHKRERGKCDEDYPR